MSKKSRLSKVAERFRSFLNTITTLCCCCVRSDKKNTELTKTIGGHDMINWDLYCSLDLEQDTFAYSCKPDGSKPDGTFTVAKKHVHLMVDSTISYENYRPYDVINTDFVNDNYIDIADTYR